MEVYVDILVAINVFVNYFLLLATKGILKIHIKRVRLFLGAFAGGLYSLVIFLPNVPDLLSLVMNIAASSLIVFISMRPKNIKQFLKDFAAFFSVNFAFAGIMLAVWLLLKPRGMVYNNSVVYFDIDIKILVLSTVLCYAVLSVISYFLKRKAPDNRIVEITLYNKGHTVMTKALIDTGNSLSDGFSSRPVIIADKSIVEKMIDFSLNDFFDGNNALTYNDKNIRLIPFNTVGGGGLLKAVKIERVEIPSEKLTVDNVLLAQSNTDFSSDEYSVLLNSDILNERGKYNEGKTQTVISENKKYSFKK